MTVIETSAFVAIYRLEPDHAQMWNVLVAEENRVAPASAIVEFSLLRHIGASRMSWLRAILADLRIGIHPIDAEVAEIAAAAAGRYGRGSRHAAKLNFGDCMSYAVAKHLGAPLLYKGGDFIHTDIESALPA